MVEKRFIISSEIYEYTKDSGLNSSFAGEYNNFENQYNTFYDGLFESQEIYVPTNIFSSKTGTFQAIVKYLKEHHSKKFSEIAKLTGRDQRTIWNTYNQANQPNQPKNSTLELGKVEDSKETDVLIPLSTIKNRNFSVLENVILYLKELGLSFNEIAALLKRNYQTIYTTHRNARRRVK